MKPTHKLKAIGGGEVAAVLATARSRSAAARALGVNRSSLNRWIAAGKVQDPRRRKRRARATETLAPSSVPASPAEWAQSVREKYELNETHLILLRMAERAATIALDDKVKHETQLAATARYQRLVQQLDLEEEVAGDGEAQAQVTTGAVRPWPRRVG